MSRARQEPEDGCGGGRERLHGTFLEMTTDDDLGGTILDPESRRADTRSEVPFRWTSKQPRCPRLAAQRQSGFRSTPRGCPVDSGPSGSPTTSLFSRQLDLKGSRGSRAGCTTS